MRHLLRFSAAGLLVGFSAILIVPLAAQTAPELREPDWFRISGLQAPPALTARSALLVDVESHTILYSKDPDLVIPPASLTKLVAIDVALIAAERGELSLVQQFTPPAIAWAENQPAGSSLMFLGAGAASDSRGSPRRSVSTVRQRRRRGACDAARRRHSCLRGPDERSDG
jgi:D-alanyl-D-alanine carboxypeptidase